LTFDGSTLTVSGTETVNAQSTINTTTPGTAANYGIHFGGQSTADYATGMTFSAGNAAAANANAGIYVQGSGAYGTRMYIATTDSYSAGSKTAISISEGGIVNFVRARPTYAGNTILDAANYNSYAPTLTGTGASGSWSISVTGSSGSVSGLTLTSSANGINPDDVTQNQLGYNTSVSLFGQSDGGLYSSAYSSAWIHQIYGDFRTGQIAIRGKNSGAWQSWRTVLDSGNYNSYAPTLTGTGASGTWAISISGNAASSSTVTVSAGNNSGTWYPIVWHSGNYLYSSSGVAEIYPAGGYARFSYINTTDNDVDGISRFVVKNGDDYHRSATTTLAANTIRGVASGSWAISITGNAASSTYGTYLGAATDSRNQDNISNRVPSGFWESNTPGAGWPSGASSWWHLLSTTHSNTSNYYALQLSASFFGQALYYRSTNGSGTTTWSQVVLSDSGSYTLTASNASALNGWSYTSYAYRSGGTGYYQISDWLQMNGTFGIYWPSYYGFHIAPNITSTYTQGRILGNKGSYGGLYDEFSAVNGIMYDGNGNGGVYREANSRWYWYYNISNTCLGVSSSTTSSSYGLYVTGAIYATGDIVAYSDRRKKTNIVTIEDALAKVKDMRGVFYERVDEIESRRHVGVIAQEMNEILPEAVTYAEDIDEYGVKYGNIVGVLIEAIKEQQSQIDQLKEHINKLESR
jgi:hypothetical protein